MTLSDSASAAGRVFYDGFESGNTDQWQLGTHAGAYAKCDVVTSAIDGDSGPPSGTRMARCNWDGTQGVDYGHQHQQMNLPSASWPFTSEWLLRFRIRADNDKDSNPGAKFLRWGNFNDNVGGDMSTMVDLGGFSLVTSFWGQGGELLPTVYGPEVFDKSWHTIELYVKKATSGGVVSLWYDDTLVRTWTGNTQQQNDVWYLAMMSNWSLNPGWDHDANNHVYWDEFEIFSDTGTGSTGSMSDGTMTQGGGDTTAPTTPGTPTCNATSSTSITCSWTASTDAVGVTGYKIERCQHHGCTTFAEVATSGTNSYTDTVPQSTAYAYRVRAYDAAGNNSGYSSTTEVAAPTPPTPFGYGVSVSNEVRNYSAADRTHVWDDLAELGVEWVRIDMSHSWVEPTQNSFNWAIYDTIVSELNARNIKFLPILDFSPAWNRDPAATSSNAKPTSNAAFANFAALAVARYKNQGVKQWEIWNEPNLNTFWQPNGANAAEYTALLKEVYNAIKAADPEATVLAASSPGGDYANSSQNGERFLEQIYINGGRHYFDGLAWHPYSYPDTPGGSQLWNGIYMLENTTHNLRGQMAAHGDSLKQIWFTEFGAPSPNGTNAVSLSVQASEHITNAFTILGGKSYAGPSFYYSNRDYCTNTTDKECWFGLTYRDWSRKPSFAAYQALTGNDTTAPAAPTGLGVQ